MVLHADRPSVVTVVVVVCDLSRSRAVEFILLLCRAALVNQTTDGVAETSALPGWKNEGNTKQLCYFLYILLLLTWTAIWAAANAVCWPVLSKRSLYMVPCWCDFGQIAFFTGSVVEGSRG